MAGTLSAFFDECGQENKFQPNAKYYQLTVVLHDQGDPIDALIAAYEANLRESCFPTFRSTRTTSSISGAATPASSSRPERSFSPSSRGSFASFR